LASPSVRFADTSPESEEVKVRSSR
jgi:hypothetical protein